MEIARFLVAEPVWCEEGPYGGPPLRDGAGGHGQGREKKPPRPKRPSPSQDTSPSELRATVGKATVEASEAIDSNLRLFRTACLGVMALSGAYIIYKSSAVNRVTSIKELSCEAFSERQRLPCRVMRPPSRQTRPRPSWLRGPAQITGGHSQGSPAPPQALTAASSSESAIVPHDAAPEEAARPRVLWVEHTPFLRRLLHIDKLSFGGEDASFAVRPFGVSPDEEAERWWQSCLHPGSAVRVELLYRDAACPDVAVGHVSYRPSAISRRRDLASEVIRAGVSTVAEEEPGGGASAKLGDIRDLERKMHRLARLEWRAKVRGRGRWTGWEGDEDEGLAKVRRRLYVRFVRWLRSKVGL